MLRSWSSKAVMDEKQASVGLSKHKSPCKTGTSWPSGWKKNGTKQLLSTQFWCGNNQQFAACFNQNLQCVRERMCPYLNFDVVCLVYTAGPTGASGGRGHAERKCGSSWSSSQWGKCSSSSWKHIQPRKTVDERGAKSQEGVKRQRQVCYFVTYSSRTCVLSSSVWKETAVAFSMDCTHLTAATQSQKEVIEEKGD